MTIRIFASIFFFALNVAAISLFAQSGEPGWPSTTSVSKPWTRWWWHGSAVTKEGITAELEAFKKAGIGGVEITPIYGVHGFENQFVNYLSPEWMALLDHVLKEAVRLDLGVDMATGTGWPFGGPWISDNEAAKNFQHKTYELKGGQRLKEKITFVQQPYLRVIGSSIYESNKKDGAVLKEQFKAFQAKKIDIKNLQQPIEKNKDLQSYAIDQVQFERSLPLVTLMGYSTSGKTLDLTKYVDKDGRLNWKAPKGDWKLYAVFQGWHGKMVERAAPGGEGSVVDHFSPSAVDHYLSYFDKAFQGHDIKSLRAFFNDSYEVDDGKGSADWTPELFEEFIKRRGYDLREHLPALFGKDSDEKNERVLSDYRQTISDMLHQYFTEKWRTWASKYNAIVRNQAHGSPANILDLYGVIDIPEIEGTEPLRIKMASSAGNVMGKPLVSSESATWLNDHFESNLHDIKRALDRFMLHGVNHLFYHGTAYSPVEEPWPGWVFYAAIHANPRNPLWKDFGALNRYVERCQSFLQNSKSDNDVLLYYPIYDRFATRGPKMLEHFDGVKQFEGSVFVATAEKLLEENYAFDYISDAQINNLIVQNNSIITEGKSRYQILLVPSCKYIPLPTLEKIHALAAAGAKVVFVDALPNSFSGFANAAISQKKFSELTRILSAMDKSIIIKREGLVQALEGRGIRREVLPQGLSFIRKKQSDGAVLYFISNGADKKFEGWITLQSDGNVVMYDPMTGVFGSAAARGSAKGAREMYVQMEPGQSLILQFTNGEVAGKFPYCTSGTALPIEGEWQLQFSEGGPVIPSPLKTRSLASWTSLGQAYADFSGACTYKISFPKPGTVADVYVLDLGVVKESASVSVNGTPIGTLIGPTYKIYFDGKLLRESNELEVRVSNLMANRIASMDRNGVFWKKFYNVNVAANRAENRLNGIFDASAWVPKESGLLGPVTISPAQQTTLK